VAPVVVRGEGNDLGDETLSVLLRRGRKYIHVEGEEEPELGWAELCSSDLTGVSDWRYQSQTARAPKSTRISALGLVINWAKV
jgi:hypothetical protein